LNPWLVVESKERADFPKWLLHAMDQAIHAAGPDELPVAILHPKGGRYDNDLVVMRLSDFQEWFCDGDDEDDEDLRHLRGAHRRGAAQPG
jgi:hypothetical protein